MSGKSHCCNNTFTNILFYIAADKEYLMKIQIIFKYVNSAFPQLHFLKFSFSLVDISKSYTK